MLKIRMQRTGRTNAPSYRIVVVEHTASPKAGKFVERLGSYDPKTKMRDLDALRVKYWMSVGAKPSDTMHNMLVSLGILDAKKINVLPAYKEPTKEESAAEAAPAEEPKKEPASADPSAEASAQAGGSGELKEEASPEEKKEGEGVTRTEAAEAKAE